MTLSVQPEWCRNLPLQQQSVLFLAARGPDGVRKFHPAKGIQRAYRACVLLAAKFGRPLAWGERRDDFMSLQEFVDPAAWQQLINDYIEAVDELPHHFHVHLLYGAQILAYKHPDERYRTRWRQFYMAGVEDLHMVPESEREMDVRLSDWERKFWDPS